MNEPQLEFVFRVDIQRILQSTWAAHNGLAGALPIEGVRIYQAGFLAALTAVGLAVGVDWQDTPCGGVGVGYSYRYPVREYQGEVASASLGCCAFGN